MESLQLSAFYRSLTQWPRTRSELTSVAERVGRLLDCAFAAVYAIDETGERIGSRWLSSPAAETLDSSEIFDDFLRNQIVKRAEELGTVPTSSGTGTGLRHLQIARDGTPWAAVSQVQHLCIAGIPGGALPGLGGPLGGSRRPDYGWLIVGSLKALGTKEEILLLSAAQKLSELAKIAQLDSAVQLRSQFLSIASHELKTPLTSIYGILQLQERMARLKKDDHAPATPADEERKRSFLKIVIRQVERLNELIDGLLDVSRIQNNRFVVEPADTDVAATVRETVGARLSVIAQEAGVKLNVDAPPLLMGWVDPMRMEEVVTNLVMNAIRFSPEGGIVWIRLREDGGSFSLTVRDQGPSVPVEDRERIFQPFERAARTSRLGGLGLGLFISRQIAQLHGGNVSLVESVPGKGNVFEARFPSRNVNVISA